MHSVTAKVCRGPVTTRTVALREQINRLSAYQHYRICRQRDGILVGSELYRPNVAYPAEAKLWDINLTLGSQAGIVSKE